ncbi:MAG: iron ABC transporter permease [Planctomycetia bacterium]|nr:iron ABC transporter permease [Planctomycetia bacterium]
MRGHGEEYRRYLRRKGRTLGMVAACLVPAVLLSLSWGAVEIPWSNLWGVICGTDTTSRYALIVLQSRLPQTLAAVLAGMGLAASGGAMQAVLRNPLCSPFTLGIASGAAFGAALAVFCGGTGYFGVVTLGAFLGSLSAVGVVLGLSRLRKVQNETVLLMGVAMSSFYGAGILFLQYLADEQQLAAMVFWTFGDTARVTWPQLYGLIPLTVVLCGYFAFRGKDYNALSLGSEAARGLGVPVVRLRGETMFLASLLTAVWVAAMGIIGFVGLVIPHLSRKLVGSDDRFVLPLSMVSGALLLLLSDMAARWVFAPKVLPVSLLTAFLGGPIFLSMLLRKEDA